MVQVLTAAGQSSMPNCCAELSPAGTTSLLQVYIHIPSIQQNLGHIMYAQLLSVVNATVPFSLLFLLDVWTTYLLDQDMLFRLGSNPQM